uniref:BSD domain-containing protein n=2 Tax=gambiae species complex TaxID=44542 RepID=A0A904A3K3_ANOQN|nr:synapse-associated protein of 47 kDa isoform X3 [Anopheles coluzzii]XP_049462831.1 synapse-associated protein of 47 kDa isoform X3 [Anopheles coluzzii]XP_049462832.1 synapse-associated protein of 47 kDa isoform X3 [Anopheles coluzzii]XP_049462833.1 synapse-associated protein of 47 kDa isoform X3 [Anopheles coluzzii]
MFSGLTNQVTSWIGAAKGEPQDEEVPTPPNSAATTATATTSGATAAPTAAPVDATAAAAGGDGGDKSPTKGGVFSGVSSKVTGWLGNASIPSMPAIPTVSMPAMPAMPSMPSIPGLRKANQTDENGGITNEGLVTSPEKASQGIAGSTDAADEEDRSRYISATGGADSRPATGPGTPTEENAGQIGQVTHKVTAGAKSIGSFLYSSFNKAGDKIKHLKDNSILGEFSKEQEAFIKNQQGGGSAGACPWTGHANEAKIKEEILSLSADRRNFVRAPPAGVEFDFDYDSSYPVALAIMNDDKELEKMRFELVPKIITEENFWRNYFYRVSLICQAADLGTLGDNNEFVKRGASEDTEDTERTSSVGSMLNQSGDISSPATSPEEQTSASPLSPEQSPPAQTNTSDLQSGVTNAAASKPTHREFISDSFHTNEQDLEEVKAGMKKLGIDSLAQQANESIGLEHEKSEEQWEKDLEAELQDYELVNDGSNERNSNWEKDVDELLEDEADLK